MDDLLGQKVGFENPSYTFFGQTRLNFEDQHVRQGGNFRIVIGFRQTKDMFSPGKGRCILEEDVSGNGWRLGLP